MITNKKHWYYDGEIISKANRVRCACGFYGNIKTEVDLANPTCEVCLDAKADFEKE